MHLLLLTVIGNSRWIGLHGTKLVPRTLLSIAIPGLEPWNNGLIYIT